MNDILLPSSIAKLSSLCCGCARDESTWGTILAELERCERKEYLADDGWPQSLCDWAGATEHGTSVRAAWLTKEGIVALAFLREHGISWRGPCGDGPLFVDKDGTAHGSKVDKAT